MNKDSQGGKLRVKKKPTCRNSALQTTRIYYREEFTNPKTGQFFKKGETIKRPMFAKTLKQIGENGTSDIFYHGSLGEKIVKEIQSLKGIITMEDLKSYKYYILPLAMFVTFMKLKNDMLQLFTN